jgi:uncharacterized membrane protein (UPF0127 family)
MEVLCRLSYSGGEAMIATARLPSCHHDGVRRALSICVPTLLIAALILAGCGGNGSRPTPAGLRVSVTIQGPGGRIELPDLEVARTEEQRAKGLMGRTSLAEDGGMVFLFGGPTTAAFWMKDTLIPLSVLFWSDDGKVIDILDMQPCRGNPCPTYAASQPYVGAIEMNEGAFQRLGVKVGDTVAYRLSGQ